MRGDASYPAGHPDAGPGPGRGLWARLTGAVRKSSCTVKFTIQRALSAQADNARHRPRRRRRFPDGLSPSPDAWPALYPEQDLLKKGPPMKTSLMAAALLAVPAFALATTASAADGVSYNYVQGGYAATNGDNDFDADGWAIDGSVAVHPNFHLFGAFNQQEIDDTNIDVDRWRAGVGYNHEVSPRTDLLTRIAYEKFDAG